MPFNPPLTQEEVVESFELGFLQGPRYVGASLIGQGGQGVVFQVELPTGELRALKIYYPDQTPERIRREVAWLEEIEVERCGSLPRIFESGLQKSLRSEQVAWVESELIDGVSLSDVLKSCSLSLSEALQMAGDVARAIQVLWNRRVVHRDIKPDNIMRRTDGSHVLLDLALARDIQASPLTQVGGWCGTPGYMSPEQARATRALSCRSDVYCLGVVFVECLLGGHPTGRDQSVLMTPWFEADKIGVDLPEALSNLLGRMLQQKASLRPTADDVLNSLQEIRKTNGL